MRFAHTMLPASLAAAPLSRVQAQQTDEQLAARCSELGAIFDRWGARRGEGSGGPNMARLERRHRLPEGPLRPGHRDAGGSPAA